MRILHCIPTLEGGGAERQLCYLAKGLVEAGHDVQVVCMRGGVNESRLRASGASVEIYSKTSLSSPVTVCWLLRTIRRFHPDLMQTWLCQMDVWGGLAARWAGVPWVLSERSSAEAYPPTLKNRARRHVARGGAMVVANSHAGAEYWWRAMGGRPRPLRVIRNALPFGEIEVVAAVRPAAIGVDDRIILYAGRLEAEKNLQVLFRALPRVLENGAIQVLICGDGSETAELKKLALDLGIADRVCFLGYVGNLHAIMKAADVFVSVSRFEGQPNTVMEAMACRCPLVVSDTPAHREFLDDESAYFAPVDSSEGIATQILACLNSPVAAHGKAAVARSISERWNLPATVAAYLGAYAGLSVRPSRASR